MTKPARIVLVAAILALQACSGRTGGGAAPPELVGTFEDDYGIRYRITDTAWHQLPNTIYHVVHWDTAGQYLIAHNAPGNPSDPAKWTRIDWVDLADMAPYSWAYCLTVYDADTREQAESAPAADRAAPRTGCAGFPFSRMRPSAPAAPPTEATADLIVFQSEQDGNWEIYTMRLDGSERTRLTTHPAADRGPWWSPDGQRIYFRSDRSGEFTYYSMDVKGQGLEPYVPDGSPSPDGTRRIVVDRDGEFPQLVLIEGTARSILTDNRVDAILSFADWAPDGRHVLYLAGTGYGSMKIWQVDLESRVTARLTAEEGTHNTAEYSPDGTRILFNSNRDGDMSTYIMNSDGGVVRRLLPDRISAHANWASNDLIVLDTESAPRTFGVHTIHADGSELTNLSGAASGRDGWPAVRPFTPYR